MIKSVNTRKKKTDKMIQFVGRQKIRDDHRNNEGFIAIINVKIMTLKITRREA